MERYYIPKDIWKDIKKEDKRKRRRERKEENFMCTEESCYPERLKDFELIPSKFIDDFTSNLSGLKHTALKLSIEDDRKDSKIMYIITKSTLLMGTELSQKIFYSNDLTINYFDLALISLKRRQNKDLIRRLLIPLFLLKEKHWILIYINVYSSEVQIFDSYVSPCIDYTHIIKRVNSISAKSQVINQIKKELVMECVLKKSWLSKSIKFILKVVDWPKQMNKYDWGVYVCMFMYLLYQMVPISVKIELRKLKRRAILQDAWYGKITDMDELFNQ